MTWRVQKERVERSPRDPSKMSAQTWGKMNFKKACSQSAPGINFLGWHTEGSSILQMARYWGEELELRICGVRRLFKPSGGNDVAVGHERVAGTYIHPMEKTRLWGVGVWGKENILYYGKQGKGGDLSRAVIGKGVKWELLKVRSSYDKEGRKFWGRWGRGGKTKE